MKAHMESLFVAAPQELTYGRPADETEKEILNLRDIFSSIQSAIVAFTDDLEVIEMNDAARRLCGYTLEDGQGAFDGIGNMCDRRCRDIIVEAIRKRSPVDRVHLECTSWRRPEQVVSVKSFPIFNHRKTPVGAVIILEDETQHPAQSPDRPGCGFSGIVGQSPGMLEVYHLVRCLADVSTTALITGESGTGKELVAEALHNSGTRAGKPLVKVNCAALSESLLESELFGHVRGAFTGAEKDRVGRFQKAHGGTIFLDEVGDISAGVQARLLRVLQQMEFERVGDSTPIRVDVRIVTATNKDINARIKRGDFREDLYYRLKVVEIPIPPLRERKEDIPLLVEHFIGKLNAKLGRTIQGVSTDALNTFRAYNWPGNVRELEHAIEHAFIHSRQPVITVCDLPHDIKEFVKTRTTLLSYKGCDERQAILKTLDSTHWNKTRAASLLGMSRRTFYRKIKEHNIFR